MNLDAFEHHNLILSIQMTTYVIGDVQGCHATMMALVEKIGTQHGGRPGQDFHLMLVGDLVNRGPSSLATLRQIRAWGENVSVILGNHDIHLLAAACGVRSLHKTDTVQEILDAPDAAELLDWLRKQPLARLENGHLFVHAGVQPSWTAQQTMALADEVHTALAGPDWRRALVGMFGNTPALWNDELNGDDRLRCILNALTRTRYCASDGTMDFESKEAGAPPPGLIPWFDLPQRRTCDVTVVFGHWASLGLILRQNLIGLDTGCVWGRQLTAIRLEDRALLQVERL